MLVKKVAVVGGGISGSVAAIALADRGVHVDLIEKAKEWHGIGHGITIQGNALKQFKALGLYDEIAKDGMGFNNLQMFTAEGHKFMEIPVAHTGGEDLPSTLGALRTNLQDVFCRRIYATPGINVRTGTTVQSLDDNGDSVTLGFSDGSSDTYDIVIAADGIRSQIRDMLGIPYGPQPIGMSIWRVLARRPETMTCSGLYYGGPRYKAGYTPISDTHCYAFLLDEDLPESLIGGDAPLEMYLERSAGYGGDYDFVRNNVDTDYPVDFRRIEAVVYPQEQPWYQGRVALVGDAVHACPPLIAQGAALCSEDSMVLVEELEKGASVEAAFEAYWQRRLPRAGMVLQNSLQLGEWEKHPDTPGADPGRLMGETLARLAAQPA